MNRRRFFKRAGELILTLVLLLALVWAGAALWFDGPANRWLAGALAGGFVLSGLVLFVLLPSLRARAAILLLFGLVLIWWLAIPPNNTRDWQPDVARLSSARIDGNLLTIQNLRNFDYRSEFDYTERWETRVFDLEQLLGVDLFICNWGPKNIAHTITSWEFADGQHLAISIETRKEKGEEYSAVRGFFRQFEVYYVVADERDVVRLRTNYRGERLYLYRVKMTSGRARALLLDYLNEINRLVDHPRWYNALTHNCTTAIRSHLENLGRTQQFDWRILANGYLDELLYERGAINTDLPLVELRRASDISAAARAADQADDFAARIRAGLPAVGGRVQKD